MVRCIHKKHRAFKYDTDAHHQPRVSHTNTHIIRGSDLKRIKGIKAAAEARGCLCFHLVATRSTPAFYCLVYHLLLLLSQSELITARQMKLRCSDQIDAQRLSAIGWERDSVEDSAVLGAPITIMTQPQRS